VCFFHLGPSTVVLPLIFCEMLSYGGLVADNDNLTTQEEELARLYHIPIPKQTDLPISYNMGSAHETEKTVR